ncbi:MAG: AtpZ/AtpI family protein [Nitriliruptoraceae bacterium]
MPATGSSTPAPTRPAPVPTVAPASIRTALLRGIDQAYLMQADLLAAILVWAGIGWLLDRALGTRPVLLVIGAIVGYAAGLYLVWLRSQRMDAAEQAASASPEVQDGGAA